VQRILSIHSADIWAFGVDAALFAGGFVMPASAVASIEKVRFLGEVNVLTTQAALCAGKNMHIT